VKSLNAVTIYELQYTIYEEIVHKTEKPQQGEALKSYSLKNYSSVAFFLAGAFLAAAFFGLSSVFAALGATVFSTLLGLALPKEPLKRFPFSVFLSPLPMIVLILSATNVQKKCALPNPSSGECRNSPHL
jgi:hypothetical protein